MVTKMPASAGDARDAGSILGQNDSLEEEVATHSSILAWKLSWTGHLPGYSPWGHKELDMTKRTAHTPYVFNILMLS